MNLEQWQRSKKIKAEAEAAAKRTVKRVLNAVKEPAMSEFKVGDWVKTQGHIGLMVIYKVTGEKAIVDVISRTGKSIGLSGYKLSEIEHASEDEIKAGHRIDNDMGDDSHIENHISPLCKSKDV